MPEKTCLVIGATKDFDSEFITGLAKKGGEPEYFDSCDLQEEYGQDITKCMTDNDLLSVFRGADGGVHTGHLLAQKMEFFKKYASEVKGERIAARFKGDSVGFSNEFFAVTTALHKAYSVPVFEMEAMIYSTILQGHLQAGQFREFESLFLWGCGSPNLPDAIMLGAVDIIPSYILLLIIARKEPADAIDLMNRCMTKVSPGRKAWLDEMGLTKRLEKANQMLAELKESQKRLIKVGDKIEIPAVKEAIKGNRASVLFGWASWCKACTMAIPMVNKAAGRAAKMGVEVVGILGGGEEAAQIAEFKKEKGASWKSDISLSEEDRARFPSGIPFFIIVDKGGVVKDIFQGADENLEERLKRSGMLPDHI